MHGKGIGLSMHFQINNWIRQSLRVRWIASHLWRRSPSKREFKKIRILIYGGLTQEDLTILMRNDLNH